MATLRLFANLRELAGTPRLDIPAHTVGELIDAANAKFGPDFARGVGTSRVWVNGEEASMSDMVGVSDEVVLLPPVSGGSQQTVIAPADLLGFLPLVVAAIAFVANLQGQEIWTGALVAIAGMWAVDLGGVFSKRGRLFAPLAVATVAVAGSLSAHALGGAGYGATPALAAAIVLGWGIAFAEFRRVAVYAPTFLAALIAGLGAASLTLSRSAFSPDERAVDVFLVAVVAGVALGALVARLPAIPFVDPFSTTAISTVLAAILAAAAWDLDVVGYLLVGLGVAVALVAGQGLSSILRSGRVALTERAPGSLTSIDGVILAAAVYYPMIRVIL